MSELKIYRSSIVCGNIEYRETNDKRNEIIYWYDNTYYDCPENNEKLVARGYKRMKDGGWQLNDKYGCRCVIDSSCTKSKRTCYTVARISWSKNFEEFDVVCCGIRPFELSQDDYKDFVRVVKTLERKYRTDE